MKLEEIKELYKGEYVDIEVYQTYNIGVHYPSRFHTDNCQPVMEDITDDTEIGLYELMDEEAYNASLNANSCVTTDFEDWYGDKNAKILCVMLA